MKWLTKLIFKMMPRGNYIMVNNERGTSMIPINSLMLGVNPGMHPNDLKMIMASDFKAQTSCQFIGDVKDQRIIDSISRALVGKGVKIPKEAVRQTKPKKVEPPRYVG